MNPTEKGDEPRRHYPSESEIAVLVPNLKLYFSYPERSPERNKVAGDCMLLLSKTSPHWTHRAVRLWFNNNRRSYLSTPDQCNSIASGYVSVPSPASSPFPKSPTHITFPRQPSIMAINAILNNTDSFWRHKSFKCHHFGEILHSSCSINEAAAVIGRSIFYTRDFNSFTKDDLNYDVKSLILFSGQPVCLSDQGVYIGNQLQCSIVGRQLSANNNLWILTDQFCLNRSADYMFQIDPGVVSFKAMANHIILNTYSKGFIVNDLVGHKLFQVPFRGSSFCEVDDNTFVATSGKTIKVFDVRVQLPVLSIDESVECNHIIASGSHLIGSYEDGCLRISDLKSSAAFCGVQCQKVFSAMNYNSATDQFYGFSGTEFLQIESFMK